MGARHLDDELEDHREPFSGERAPDVLVKRLHSLAAEIGDETELDELTAGIQDAYGYSWEEAHFLACTAMMLRSRISQHENSQSIAQEFPSVRFQYEGPDDKLTRPFCREIMRQTADRPMTLAEIAELDNGELPNVLVTGGGWGCRHQWILAADSLTDSDAQSL